MHPRSLIPGGYRPLPSPSVLSWQPTSFIDDFQNGTPRSSKAFLSSEPVGSFSNPYDDAESINEDDDNWFFNLALLSHMAVRLRDQVPRGAHVKNGVSYPRSFTGRDVVVSSS